MRRVKKACVSSSAIPSRWSTQPSRVTLMLKVKSPMRGVYVGQPLAAVLASALVGRDDPPPDPGGAGLDRLLDRRVAPPTRGSTRTSCGGRRSGRLFCCPLTLPTVFQEIACVRTLYGLYRMRTQAKKEVDDASESQ